MALVAQPVYTVTYTFKDETGSESSTSAYIRQGVIFNDVLVRASGLAAILAQLSNAALTGYTVSRTWVETQPVAQAGSRVERKGRYIWTAQQNRSRMDIPSIAPNHVLQDGAIDRGIGTTTLLFETLMLTDFAGDFTDSRGVSLDALAAAYEAYQRTTRKRLPTRRLER